MFVEQRYNEVTVVREVSVESRLPDAGPARDLTHRDLR
jgi:hypothetical protein